MKYQIVEAKQAIPGTMAEIQRDSLNGDSLVVQSGAQALVIKLSDLVVEVNRLEAEKKAEEAKQPEVVINE